mgnify:FL=1
MVSLGDLSHRRYGHSVEDLVCLIGIVTDHKREAIL